MSAIETRLRELQSLEESTELDRVERAGLFFLHRAGVETLESVLTYAGTDKWAVWAAESIVWTARRLRGGEFREAVRGWGQCREYAGRNGGFLPCGLSDQVGTLQNALEGQIGPRT